MVGLFFAARLDYRALFGAAAIVFLHFVLGALLCGFSWPLAWLEALTVDATLEQVANRHNHFSIIALTRQLVPGSVGMVAGTLALGLVMVWLGSRFSKIVVPIPYWGALLCATMLLSPHLQYYDFGLLALPVMIALERSVADKGEVSLGLRWILVILYVGYVPLYQSVSMLGFQPLSVVLLGVFVWLWVLAWRYPCSFPGKVSC